MSGKRKWQPGDRNRPSPVLPHELAWIARLEGVEVRAYIHPPNKSTEGEVDYGENINLGLYNGERRNVIFSLTTLTEKELDAFQRVVTAACARARKTIVERDRIAEEAFQRGDNSYARSYRRVPVVLDRSGAFTEHGESILRGSRRAPGVDVYPDRTPSGDGGEDCSGVADDDERIDLSEYDVPPTGEHQEVFGVGAPRIDSAGFLQSPDPWERRAAPDS